MGEEGKDCPFMTRPCAIYSDYSKKEVTRVVTVKCRGKECAAWGIYVYKYVMAGCAAISYDTTEGCRLMARD